MWKLSQILLKFNSSMVEKINSLQNFAISILVNISLLVVVIPFLTLVSIYISIYNYFSDKFSTAWCLNCVCESMLLADTVAWQLAACLSTWCSVDCAQMTCTTRLWRIRCQSSEALHSPLRRACFTSSLTLLLTCCTHSRPSCAKSSTNISRTTGYARLTFQYSRYLFRVYSS